jgi:hypothetical protein
LWTYIHGGGAGYSTSQGYHPCNGSDCGGDKFNNVEESYSKLASYLPPGGDSTMTRRAAEGHRFLYPAMGDHDFHSGIGTAYPDKPNHGGSDTVDGLLALMAAIDFTFNQAGANQVAHRTNRRPT